MRARNKTDITYATPIHEPQKMLSKYRKRKANANHMKVVEMHFFFFVDSNFDGFLLFLISHSSINRFLKGC